MGLWGRISARVIARRVNAQIKQISDELAKEYANRLQILESELSVSYRTRIQDLEERIEELEKENQQLSERPTIEKYQALQQQFSKEQQINQRRITSLRKAALGMMQDLPDPLEELRLLRHVESLITAPQENPLYLALYFRVNPTAATSQPTYRLIPKKHVITYLVNSPNLKELTMLGFSLFPDDVLILDNVINGKITLVGQKLNVPETNQTQVISYTPEEYLRNAERSGRSDSLSAYLVYLARQADYPKSHTDPENKLLFDSLKFPIPLPKDVAISLAYHLSKHGSLDGFAHLDVLQERASYFD